MPQEKNEEQHLIGLNMVRESVAVLWFMQQKSIFWAWTSWNLTEV